MAKGINFNTVMTKIHDDARKAYIVGGDKQREHFQIMLNVEMNFWRKPKCGSVASALHYHDMLTKKRKTAMETVRLKESLC